MIHPDREIRRSGARRLRRRRVREIRRGTAGARATTCSNRCTPRKASGWPRRRSGSASALAVIDVTNGKNPEAQHRAAPIRRSFTPKANSAKKKAAFRCPDFAGTWRVRCTSRCARRTPAARNSRCAAKGLLARAFCHEIDHLNGSSLHQPPQHAQARPDQAQNPQTEKSRRLVGASWRCESSSAARLLLRCRRCGI